MKKGEGTRETILETGLEMASLLGLENVTIGNLAVETNMSKSGLFGHFQSKENLQIAILKHAGEDFTNKVIIPALKTPRGIERIKTLVEKWIEYSSMISGGCIFVTASTEYSDRPGKVRKVLLDQQNSWIDSLKKMAISAVKSGEFVETIDANQFAFDLYSLLLGYHYYHRLLNDRKSKKRQEEALVKLLESYRK
ncbi:TetR/AcrR family transcriptional regulator [Bacteroidota bacterium]